MKMTTYEVAHRKIGAYRTDRKNNGENPNKITRFQSHRVIFYHRIFQWNEMEKNLQQHHASANHQTNKRTEKINEYSLAEKYRSDKD